jgi:hypothetical protein
MSESDRDGDNDNFHYNYYDNMDPAWTDNDYGHDTGHENQLLIFSSFLKVVT